MYSRGVEFHHVKDAFNITYQHPSSESRVDNALVRRSPDEWIEASDRHEALITTETFERAQEVRATASVGPSATA